MARRKSATRDAVPAAGAHSSAFPTAEPVPSSPTRRRPTKLAAATFLDSPTDLSPEEIAVDIIDQLDGRAAGAAAVNPRSFSYSVKQQCWDRAEKVKGRDPDRWRRDALGNIVFRKLVGCPGCLCHDFDHIVPYSKGGKSTLENCQVLQATVNRSKGNNMDISDAELAQKSAYCKVSGRDMDLLEISAYGNVRRGPDTQGCNIQ